MSAPKPSVLIVDDEPAQRQLLSGLVESLGLQPVPVASAEEALDCVRTRCPAMVLLDVRLPGMSGIDALAEIRQLQADLPVLLLTAFADVRQAVAAMKGGADDYLAKPIDLEELKVAIVDAIGPADAADAVRTPQLPDDVVCESAAMRRVLEMAAIVAPASVPVLILGESGSGKEILAQLLHAWSPRAAGPLVVANCAGLPETLIESELFGHTKGAFTGAAAARPGFFRAAHGGTLFLDEIGELPLHLQPKLLRALESGRITAVGSEAAEPVDVRLIAATNRDLGEAVRQGEFRDDLYYRINVVELAVPPLRERVSDILPMARRFASQFAGRHVRLSPQATQCLLTYAWPGNVRELRNAVQRACLLCRGDVILPEHLPPTMAPPGGAAVGQPAATGRLSQVERATILATLEECGGNRTHAARKLGISRRALIYKLRDMDG